MKLQNFGGSKLSIWLPTHTVKSKETHLMSPPVCNCRLAKLKPICIIEANIYHKSPEEMVEQRKSAFQCKILDASLFW